MALEVEFFSKRHGVCIARLVVASEAVQNILQTMPSLVRRGYHLRRARHRQLAGVHIDYVIHLRCAADPSASELTRPRFAAAAHMPAATVIRPSPLCLTAGALGQVTRTRCLTVGADVKRLRRTEWDWAAADVLSEALSRGGVEIDEQVRVAVG